MNIVVLAEGFRIPSNCGQAVREFPTLLEGAFRNAHATAWYGTDNGPSWDLFGNNPNHLAIGYGAFLDIWRDVALGAELSENDGNWVLEGKPIDSVAVSFVERRKPRSEAYTYPKHFRAALVGVDRLIEMHMWEEPSGGPLTAPEAAILGSGMYAVGKAISTCFPVPTSRWKIW